MALAVSNWFEILQRQMWYRRFQWLIACLCFFVGCRPSVPPRPRIVDQQGRSVEAPPPPSAREEEEASILYQKYRVALEQGRRHEAARLRKSLARSYFGTVAAADAILYEADALLSNHAYDDALQIYQKFLAAYQNHLRQNEAWRGYGMALAGLQMHSRALEAFELALSSTTSSLQRGQILEAKFKSHQVLGDFAGALIAWVQRRAIEVPEPSVDETTQDLLNKLDLAAAGAVFKRFEDDKSWHNVWGYLGLHLAELYAREGRFDDAESLLKKMERKSWKDPQVHENIAFQIKRLAARTQVDANAVGVLLPLSGRFKLYGERALQAIRLAIPEHLGLRLVVKDTEGDADIAAQKVESLVTEDHVIAMIGPLFPKESMRAAEVAQQYGVSLLSISYAADLPDIGSFVFQHSLTVQDQAQELAKVAFEQHGYKRFAILYPDSNYGRTFMNAFWDEVDARQGEIRAVEKYTPRATTFTEPVQRMVGRYHRWARPEYADKIKELRAQKMPPHRLQAQIEEFQKRLPPAVDFDAIIIPDGGRTLGLIAPALAFEDIILTRDPKALERIQKATGYEELHPVTLMGGSTWNSARTLQHCERYCEGAIFVDGYDRQSTDPTAIQFLGAFRDATGAEPRLMDAQAYDAGLLVREALARKRRSDRDGFKGALQDIDGLRGVTGNLIVSDNGKVSRALVVFTLQNRSIQVFSGVEPNYDG